MNREDAKDIVIWVVLLILLLLTMGASYADWGVLSTALSFMISGLKTLLIAYFYMHLKHEKGMTRIFAVAGAAWLVVFLSLAASDYATRSWMSSPSRWPIIVQLRPSLNETRDHPVAPRPGEFGIGR